MKMRAEPVPVTLSHYTLHYLLSGNCILGFVQDTEGHSDLCITKICLCPNATILDIHTHNYIQGISASYAVFFLFKTIY